ncbi:hypothetical protein ACFSBZ_01310 [Amnibacterium flavum]|uniref:Uncharacterized protein n=1 Tax=Amnibacterium flavum TaxID=2173173 RepID=A0A2V1HQI8_9MICO|nr:hypothetical protein [Amnibacterium flavum]PVZ94805.1 hypothetical protein DDQ50_14115 [Amnibacterium flavum]
MDPGTENWPRWARALASPVATVVVDVLLVASMLLLAFTSPYGWMRFASWFVVVLVIATSVLQFVIWRRKRRAHAASVAREGKI